MSVRDDLLLPPWLSGRWPQSLIDQAAFERDRREHSYPKAIRDNRIGEAEATGDWLAWGAIHDWMAAGLMTFSDWPSMEAAAAKALAAVDAKVAASAASDAALADLQARRARLFAIHHGVERMADWIDETNRQLRAQRDQRRAAAA